jgi:hypothetical protein
MENSCAIIESYSGHIVARIGSILLATKRKILISVYFALDSNIKERMQKNMMLLRLSSDSTVGKVLSLPPMKERSFRQIN